MPCRNSGEVMVFSFSVDHAKLPGSLVVRHVSDPQRNELRDTRTA